MNKQTAPLIATLAAVLFVAGASAQTNLLQNGSFEAGPAIGAGQTGITLTGNQLPGWFIPVGNVDVVSSFWNPSHGVRAVDLHGIVPGAIEQAFTTTVGQQYDVTFDLGASGHVMQAQLSAAGLVSPVFSHSGPSFPNVTYSLDLQWSFVASAAVTTLRFEGVGTPGGLANGPHIDNVRIFAGPIPHPATATPYGSGCGTPPLGFVPDPAARPIIGTTAGVTITNAPTSFAGVTMGWSDTALTGLPLLPLPLGFIGMPGCSLLHSNDVFGLPTNPLTASTLEFDYSIPVQSSLIGADVYLQAYCFAPGENALQIIVSNGINWTIGNQ